MRGGLMLIIKALLFLLLLIFLIGSGTYLMIWGKLALYQSLYLASLGLILVLSFVEFRVKAGIFRHLVFILKVLSYLAFLVLAEWVIIDPVSTIPLWLQPYLLNVINVLWWLIPATMIGQAVNRYIFNPIETYLELKIPRILTGLFYFCLYAAAMSCILAFEFNYQITAILTASGLLTVIIGLAIRANLSNIFSGLFLTMDRPFNRGDWVEIGSHKGVIEGISWRTTILKNYNNSIIVIPNEKVAQSTIINLTPAPEEGEKPPLYTCKKNILIHPDHDPAHVQAILQSALEKTLPIDKRPEFGKKNILLTDISQDGLHFRIDFDVKAEDYVQETHNVLLNVHKVLAQAGIRPTPGRLNNPIESESGLHAVKINQSTEKDYENKATGLSNIYYETLKNNVILSRMNLFRTLSKQSIDMLAKHTERVTFLNDENIVTQGEGGDSMYVIIDGVVKILINVNDKQLQVARLGPSDFFGEMSLMTGEPRTATVTSVGQTIALEIKKKDMKKVFDKYPETVRNIAMIIAKRKLANEKNIAADSDPKEAHKNLGEKIMDKMKAFFGLKT